MSQTDVLSSNVKNLLITSLAKGDIIEHPIFEQRTYKNPVSSRTSMGRASNSP